MDKRSLVVMAAGIGSRYKGGIKQMARLGPCGEYMIDYSVYDAMEAGFNKVVFIIRKDLEKDFRELIGDKFEKHIEVAYAFQEIEDLPEGVTVAGGRAKPWGTGQALYAARNVINEPFVVINADDYYGKFGYRALYDYLSREHAADGKEQIALAAFVLRNTLSDNGVVTRGILKVEDGKLKGLDETKGIYKRPDGSPAIKKGDEEVVIDRESMVSMNIWALYPSFLDRLEGGFRDFLGSVGDDINEGEYLLPDIIDGLVTRGEADVEIIKSDDIWFGVTYSEDSDTVSTEFRKLVDKGVYRSPLFD